MRQILEQIKEVWNRLPMMGRVATISSAVATLGLMTAIVYYGTQSEYGVLFSDLKPADAQTIVEKLKSSGVPYNLTNGGTTVQVPVEKISELRLEMASSGVISGGHVGFDLFDKTSFGATDFAQQVNYRRAIEGELARTLEGMDEVEAARLHFTPKRESIFTEKEEGAKASVMLRVRQGKELSQERTEAIVNLVASSIEGLDPSNVSVMDTRGRLLTAGGRNKDGKGGDAGAFNAQLDSRRKFETETAARVTSMLEPIVGANGVRADVAADVDFSQIEQTEEKFNPQSQVVRSQQSAELKKNTQSTSPAQVAVGARAKDPTAQLPNNPQNQQVGNDERVQTTTNYEIDKTVRRTVGGGGRVNRLTVSVVVDHKTVNETQVARTAAELQQIESLVAAAVGIDENRGDSVVVQTMPFAKSQNELASPAFSWFENNKRLISTAIKYGMLVLAALLILFFVVRPAKRHLKLAMAGNEEDVKQLGAGEEATDTENEETADTDEKRLTAGEEEKQLENILPQGEIGMTVSEIEAQMNGEKPEPDKVEVRQKEAEEISQEESAKRSLESVRQILLEGEADESEIVVGTLRGWLRE